MRTVGVVFTVVGILALIYSGFLFHQAATSYHWPTTEGTVHTSEVSQSMYRNRLFFVPSVSYSYVVDSNSYTSDDIRFTRTLSKNYKEQEAVVAKYPVNSTVTVYYDPRKPSSAVLEPGLPVVDYGFGVVATLFLTVGVYLLLRKETA